MNDNPQFRLVDFQVSNERVSGGKKGQDNKEFVIQMFGMNESGETCSIFVKNFQPFFFIKVGSDWGRFLKTRFIEHIKEKLRIDSLKDKYKKSKKGNVYPQVNGEESESEYINRNKESFVSYYENSIVDSRIIERHKLYGFDANKLHRFIYVRFKNTTAMHKIKNIWYNIKPDPKSIFGRRYILKPYIYQGARTELYEAKLPPLLRYFHIQAINPSGWVELPLDKIVDTPNKTYCEHEYTIGYEDIIPLHDKETAVPLIVASFDIEASSSHGDFPVAIKTYKKLVGDIITYWTMHKSNIGRKSKDEQKLLLIKLIKTAFGYDDAEGINVVYTKKPVDEDYIEDKITMLLNQPLNSIIESGRRRKGRDRNRKSYRDRDADDDEEIHNISQSWGLYVRKKDTMLDYLNDAKFDAGQKLEIIDEAVKIILPALEGDTVTFIGTTFMRVGEAEPFLNHMIVVGDCDLVPVHNSETVVECCDSERDLLMAWTEMMRDRHPDVLIGYNIFGFDWKFMCERAEELDCFKPGPHQEATDEDVWFSELSRNKREYCKKVEKEIKLASGTHKLTYIKMPGVVQIDLHNYFRREVNLSSYTLNNVASHFIGDMIKDWRLLDDTTVIESSNLMGLQRGNFVCFELIGHSTDSYENGRKFKVVQLDVNKGQFIIEGRIDPPKGTKLRWGLGKDDISPQDIFRLTRGTASDRAIIAKYCFQDCNLVHHLFRKNDILTGMSEQAAICSVPIDYVVMRGQGIKVFSFIAKKCREKNTLMPVIHKPDNDGSYEGAICLKPKRGLYVDDPVAVVDYSSLYPSCMISENISHDSEVWTKEYDLEGNLLTETGSDEYDNLEEYEYVNVEYDTYEWIAPPGKKKEEKVKVGTKICRFAQYPGDKKAIMPATLQGLLAARKATRAKIKFKTVTFKDGHSEDGLVKKKGDQYEITYISLDGEHLKKTVHLVDANEVVEIKETYNTFTKNVYNQRQASIKIVANSLYGQCGFSKCEFYNKDIAASTTATGRKLLLYAQRVIEDVYGDAECDTKYGKVRTRAEYIYGDTDSIFFTFHLRDMDGKAIVGKKALDITIELAVKAGELASKFLKPPHDLEYEKTFTPFLLVAKKKYVGILYEHDPNKGKRKEMGIVLKRRDNAPIVKDIYGGLIDILMKQNDIGASIEFVKSALQDIIDEHVPLEKLIITKKLNGFYKNPRSIAHRVLADRIGKRDPGNKPAVGSRIPFVYIETKGKKKLQGDKIESPSYIKKHSIRPDYGFYITNQIMVPVSQVFSLVLEQIPAFKRRVKSFKIKCDYLKQQYKDEEKYDKKEDSLRSKEVKRIVFDCALRQAQNIKDGQSSIKKFFN